MVARIKAAANVALGDMTLSCLDTNSCQSASDEREITRICMSRGSNIQPLMSGCHVNSYKEQQ